MQHEMPQSLLVFAYPLRRKWLILGRSMEYTHTPLENFFTFSFLRVYKHMFEIYIIKIEFGQFRVQNPLNS